MSQKKRDDEMLTVLDRLSEQAQQRARQLQFGQVSDLMLKLAGHATDDKLLEGKVKSDLTMTDRATDEEEELEQLAMAEQFVQQGDQLEASIGALLESMNKEGDKDE